MRSTPHTHLLTRTVRLAITPRSGDQPAPSRNGLVSASWSCGIEPIVEFEVSCSGAPDASGYLVDIGVIDRAVRTHLGPIVARRLRMLWSLDEDDSHKIDHHKIDHHKIDHHEPLARSRALDPAPLLVEAVALLAAHLPRPVHALAYRTSPFRSAAIECASAGVAPASAPHDARGLSVRDHPDGETSMAERSETPIRSNSQHRIVLSETFEFAASHRLHIPSLDAEANRALFGKCNNPNGHGHNYRIEVAVERSVDDAAAPFGFADLEDVVGREVMARFDHKHLNLDCPEFRDLNPSVEHIARVCHDLLAPAVAARGAVLRHVRVWETEKTSCLYPA